MISARYFDLIREMKPNAYNHRLRLVESAKERGIKPTARLFATTVPTVRKWLRRFQQHGPSGLVARPRARHHQPHKTPSNRGSVRRTPQDFADLRRSSPDPRIRSPHQPRRARTHLARAQPDQKASPQISAKTRSEEHTSELQSHVNLVCRLLLEKKKKKKKKK